MDIRYFPLFALNIGDSFVQWVSISTISQNAKKSRIKNLSISELAARTQCSQEANDFSMHA